MAAPIRSSDLKAVVEPILNKVHDGVMLQRKNEWEEVFTEVKGTARAYHEEPMLFGFTAAPEVPDGQPYVYQQGGTLFIQRYVYKVYGMAFAITKVLAEDGDHIRIGKIFAEHATQSLIETQELLGANTINRAFNSAYVGGDGVSLVNSAHPIYGGLTFSNQLASAAALSQTSLEQLLIQMRSAVDSTGRKIRVEPYKIVCGPSNLLQAEVLLKSVLRTGAMVNDINPVPAMGLLKGGQANLARLTSNTAWFILASKETVKMGLQMVRRRGVERSMEGDFETDSARYKLGERYAPHSWTDPRALWGTPGL
jgi:hypothetical protein